MLNGRTWPYQTEEWLRHYRTLTEVIPQIVWTAQADGGVDYVNQKWFYYSGMDFEQTKQRGWQPALHPDDSDLVALKWRACLTSGLPFECEMRLRRFDGAY